MTNIPPSDPRSSQTNPLGFDEFIGILIAFATIGTIFWWSLSHRNAGENQWGLPLPSPNPNATSGGLKQPTPKGATSGGLLLAPGNGTGTNSTTPVTPPVQQASPDSTNQQNETPYQSVEPTPILVLPPLSYLPRQQSPQVQPTVPPSNVTEQNGVVTPVEKMPTNPPAKAFTDVPADFWARGFIDALSSRGIITGFAEDYTFRPNQPVTRAEYAAIVEKAFNRSPGGNAIAFTDLPEKFWATEAINKATTDGFLSGYPDKTFKAEQKIPRVQVLVSLASGLNLKAPSSPDKDINIYQDAKDIPQYAVDRVAAATANNLVVNYPDPKLLDPNKEATRAEVAAMVHQALVKMGKLRPIQSQSIVTEPR